MNNTLSTPTAFTRSVPPLPDVEAVAEETSASRTNRLLRNGWRLLQVIAAHDSGGGYAVYVVGKLRVQT